MELEGISTVDLNKANKGLEKQVLVLSRCQTSNLTNQRKDHKQK